MSRRGAWILVGQVVVVVALFVGVTMAVVDEAASPAIAFGAIFAAFSVAATASGISLPVWFWRGAAVYGVVVVGGEAARVTTEARWIMWVVAGVTIALSLVTLGTAVRSARRSTELERLLFAESAALALFIAVVGALTYGLLESWVDAPELSTLAIAAYGSIAWAAVALALGRRYA